jgi:hypothetical protein
MPKITDKKAGKTTWTTLSMGRKATTEPERMSLWYIFLTLLYLAKGLISF